MDDTASSSTTVPISGVHEIVKKAITEAGMVVAQMVPILLLEKVERG